MSMRSIVQTLVGLLIMAIAVLLLILASHRLEFYAGGLQCALLAAVLIGVGLLVVADALIFMLPDSEPRASMSIRDRATPARFAVNDFHLFRR